jgi:hypothetical protein
MSFGTETVDRGARRILAAMIVCGAVLTGLSLAMQLDQSAVKSRLGGLMGQANGLISPREAPQR